MKRLAIFLFSLPFLIRPASAGELRLKFSGGLSYLKLNEINRTLKGWEQLHFQFAENDPNWTFLKGNVAGLHTSADFDAELLVFFSKHFAAGLGAGFLYGEVDEKRVEVVKELKEVGTIVNVRPNKINGLPLVFSAYTFISLSPRVRIFLRGGGGLVWAKYVDRESSKNISDKNFKKYEFQRASARGSLFQGGLGLAYDLEPGISFFLEGMIRRSLVSGFFGENEKGESGTLYSYEEYLPAYDYWKADTQIWKEPPAGESFRLVREAELDLSGFSARVGLVVKF